MSLQKHHLSVFFFIYLFTHTKQSSLRFASCFGNFEFTKISETFLRWLYHRFDFRLSIIFYFAKFSSILDIFYCCDSPQSWQLARTLQPRHGWGQPRVQSRLCFSSSLSISLSLSLSLCSLLSNYTSTLLSTHCTPFNLNNLPNINLYFIKGF